MKQLVVILGLCLLLNMGSAAAAVDPPARAVISRTAEDVLAVLKDPRLQGESFLAARKKKLWAIVDRVFNYQRLARYALGRAWQGMTPEQQAEFSHLYSLLLGKTYMDRILDYGNEKIVIEKEVPLSEEVSEVQTTIFSEGRGIPVHYRLSPSDGQWKIFDVIIEGISLTGNYRSQFRNYLSRNSMEDLLAVLAQKTRGVRPDS